MNGMKGLALALLALILGPMRTVLATQIPEVQTQNGISYVTGGIGKEQSEALKMIAKDYDLMLTFATRDGEYLADVDVHIEDMNGNILVDTVSEGPLFLADLPAGRYKVTAAEEGISQIRVVNIDGGRPAEAVFHWSGYAMD
ncbi:MAG: carboxypeptidase regulatory-like domain-containing protein [Gammaproteobacteria bacterium]